MRQNTRKGLMRIGKCVSLRCATAFTQMSRLGHLLTCLCSRFVIFHYISDADDKNYPGNARAVAGSTTEVLMGNYEVKVAELLFIFGGPESDSRAVQGAFSHLLGRSTL